MNGLPGGQDGGTGMLPLTAESSRPARADAWSHAGPRRKARRTFRPRRTIPGVAVAALLAAVAICGTVQAVSAALDSPLWRVPYSTFPGSFRDTNWDATVTLAVAGAIAFAGLVLAAIGLIPGCPRAVPLASGDESVVAGAPRRSLGRSLARLVREADGVSRARVSVGRRSIRVRATTWLRDTTGLCDGVEAPVRDRLAALDPLQPPRIRVRLHRKAG